MLTEAQMRLAFEIIDTDKDGRLDMEELVTIVSRLGVKMSKLELHALLRDIDKDGDGRINYTEFRSFMLDPPRHSYDIAKMKRYFREFDVDNDGTITLTEMVEIFNKLGVPEQTVRSLFADIDKDKNGRITFQEFCDAVG